MGRKLRYIPPDSLVEVVAKTIQGRYLLRPGSEMNRRFIGVLARAKSLYDVRVHSVSCLSSHWHGFVSPADAQELALFKNSVEGNVADEAGETPSESAPATAKSSKSKPDPVFRGPRRPSDPTSTPERL